MWHDARRHAQQAEPSSSQRAGHGPRRAGPTDGGQQAAIGGDCRRRVPPNMPRALLLVIAAMPSIVPRRSPVTDTAQHRPDGHPAVAATLHLAS